MKETWKPIDVSNINFNDDKVWDLISEGHTDGLFQIESTGMTEVCKRVKPRNMEQLSAILALYRPDTMSELDHYINRKDGNEEVTYVHPDVIPISNKTFGTFIYQEQFMAISKVFAEFSDGEADMLRKGLGKKDREKVKAEAMKFHDRAMATGRYPKEVVEELTSLLMDKGGYSFNKGHSTGYAITTFKTAWLKAHYPVEFMCSLISNQRKDTGQTDYENVGKYVQKTVSMGIDVLPPDVNISKPTFIPYSGKILYGLSLLRGVGDKAIEEIIKHRPYKSFEDFLRKTDNSQAIGKGVIVSLIKAGSFDTLSEARKRKPSYITEKNYPQEVEEKYDKRDRLLREYGKFRYFNGKEQKKPLKSVNKNHIKELLDAGLITKEESTNKEYCVEYYNKFRTQNIINEWVESNMIGDIFKWEFDSISYHLSGDPFEGIDMKSFHDYEDGEDDCRVGGTVLTIKKTKIKKGKQAGREMAFIGLDTKDGIIEVIVFADDWSRHMVRLEKGYQVVLRGTKEKGQLILNGAKTLKEYLETEE